MAIEDEKSKIERLLKWNDRAKPSEESDDESETILAKSLKLLASRKNSTNAEFAALIRKKKPLWFPQEMEPKPKIYNRYKQRLLTAYLYGSESFQFTASDDIVYTIPLTGKHAKVAAKNRALRERAIDNGLHYFLSYNISQEPYERPKSFQELNKGDKKRAQAMRDSLKPSTDNQTEMYSNLANMWGLADKEAKHSQEFSDFFSKKIQNVAISKRDANANFANKHPGRQAYCNWKTTHGYELINERPALKQKVMIYESKKLDRFAVIIERDDNYVAHRLWMGVPDRVPGYRLLKRSDDGKILEGNEQIDHPGEEKIVYFSTKKEAKEFGKKLSENEIGDYVYYKANRYSDLAFQWAKSLDKVKDEMSKRHFGSNLAPSQLEENRKIDERIFEPARWAFLGECDLALLFAIANQLSSYSSNDGKKDPIEALKEGTNSKKDDPLSRCTASDASARNTILDLIPNTCIPKKMTRSSALDFLNESIITPIAKLGTKTPKSKTNDFGKPVIPIDTMRTRFHAVARALRIVEKFPPFKDYFEIDNYGSDTDADVIGLSTLLWESWRILTKDDYTEEIESHLPLDIMEIEAFCEFLASRHLGKFNFFMLGLTTGLRVTELERLTDAKNAGKAALKEYFDETSQSLIYKSLIKKVKISTKPVISPLASIIISSTNHDYAYVQRLDPSDLDKGKPDSFRQYSGLAVDRLGKIKSVSFSEIYPRRLRATMSVNLIFGEGDFDPRTKRSSRAHAAERLGHKTFETMMRHYYTSPPSTSIAATSFYRLQKPADRRLVFTNSQDSTKQGRPPKGIADDILDGIHPWDAFLLKIWYRNIKKYCDLTGNQQKSLDAEISRAVERYRANTGWAAADFTGELKLAHKTIDVVSEILRRTADAQAGHMGHISSTQLNYTLISSNLKKVFALVKDDEALKKLTEITSLLDQQTKTFQNILDDRKKHNREIEAAATELKSKEAELVGLEEIDRALPTGFILEGENEKIALGLKNSKKK